MLRWWFRDIIWCLVLVLVPVLASVPCIIDSTIYVMWCPCQWHHITKKCYIASQFDCLDIRKAMEPFMIPLVSCDASAGTNGVTCPNSHVAPHFDHLDARNAMVPLVILCSTNASSCVITWPKSHLEPHFEYLDLRNVIVPVVPLAWHAAYTGANGVTLPKSHVAYHFDHLDLREYDGVIDDANSIT